MIKQAPHHDVLANQKKKPKYMIQKTRLFRSSVLAVLFGVASAASLLAQGPGGPPPGAGGHGPHHGPPPNVLFDALDTNHDGVISADEMTNASASLKALLKNGATELRHEDLRPPRPAPPQDGGEAAGPDSDHHRPKPPEGRLDEQNAGREGRPHHGPPPNPLFDALDANHDGTISASEIDNAPAALKALLKNGATQLKREDLRPPRPPQDQEN